MSTSPKLIRVTLILGLLLGIWHLLIGISALPMTNVTRNISWLLMTASVLWTLPAVIITTFQKRLGAFLLILGGFVSIIAAVSLGVSDGLSFFLIDALPVLAIATMILRAANAEAATDQGGAHFVSPLLMLTNVSVGIAGGLLSIAFRRMFIDIHHQVGFLAVSVLALVNSLVVLSRIRQRLQGGIPFRGVVFRHAIFSGSIAALGPVLLTTVVVVLALAPMAFSRTTPRSLQEVGTVMIGGLIGSAPAALFLTPALFLLVEER